MASAQPSTASTPATSVPAPSNSIARMFGVIFSPKETFQSIVQRPTWLAPLLTIAVLLIATVAIYGHRVGWLSMMEKQDAKVSRIQQMPAAQRQQVLAAQVKYAPTFAYVEVVLIPFVGALVVASVLMAAFNIIVGTQIKFSTSFGVVSYAYVPGIILSLLGIIVLFLKDPATIDLQNLVASNAGAILPSDAPAWRTSLFAAIDIFSFWEMLLMAIGFSVTAPKKISFGKALGMIFALWLVWVALRVGLAAAFS
jgi:hypothetical protein